MTALPMSTNPMSYQFGGMANMPGWENLSTMSLTQLANSVPGSTPPRGAMVPSYQPKLGLNFDTANLALSGLNTIGNLWAAFQANSLAKQQLAFQKDVTNTNLANQIKSYNTALSDRSRSRALVEGQTPAQAQAYIDQNKLTRSTGG